jgi:hypothetical protein
LTNAATPRLCNGGLRRVQLPELKRAFAKHKMETQGPVAPGGGLRGYRQEAARRIIAHYHLIAGEQVLHILGLGKIVPAILTKVARPHPDGGLIYPAEAAKPSNPIEAHYYPIRPQSQSGCNVARPSRCRPVAQATYQAAAAPRSAAAPTIKPRMTPVRRASKISSFACAMT